VKIIWYPELPSRISSERLTH